MQEKQLLEEIAKLRQQVQQLKQDKADLEILLETTIEHSDTVEAQLQSQTEAALRESEQRLVQFLEAVPVGIFVVDATGKPYYANHTAQQLLGKGIAPAANIGQLAEVYQVYISGSDRLYPGDRLPLAQALQGVSTTVEDLEIRQGERTILLETRATPIFDEQGKVKYAIAVFQDISERKKAEKDLKAQKKQYQDIFEASSDGLIINTLEGNIAEANPAACAMHGYTHQEFTGLDPRVFIHPEYHPLFSQFIEQTYYQNTPFQGEAVDIRKDGTEINVEVSGTAFTYKGKPHILAVVRDITERKRAENQLRLTQERDRLLGEIALKIRQSLDLDEILHRTVTEVREFLQTDRVCICYINREWQTKVIAESVKSNFPSFLGIIIENQTFSREMQATFAQGVQAMNDLSQLDIPSVSAEILAQIQVKACLGVPIVLNNVASDRADDDSNGFWLLVAHHCAGSRNWQSFEIELIEQLGNQVAIAIQQAKLYQQLAALNATNEASLRQSEEQLRTLIDATPDVICFKDGAGRWLESNQANLVFLDLKGVDYRGKTDRELAQFSNFYRDALLNCVATDEQAWQHGSNYRVEEIVPRQDGTVSTYDIIKIPLFHDDGRRKGLVVLGRDISQSKHLEAELLHRAQVQSLLGNISRQFIDRDVDIAIDFTLQAIAQFIGTERSCIFAYSDDQSEFYITHEWRATGITSLSPGARGTSTDIFPWLHSKISCGEAMQIADLSEFPPEAAAEKALYTSQSIRSVVAVPTLHGGKVVGFLGTDTVNFARTWSQEDISLLRLVGELIAIGRARYKAEEALRIAKDAAEAANRAKSTFLANMSHELRTPLNAILGFAQLMERDDTLTSKQGEALATINRSGEHLLNLIDDVLQMSKIEAGRIVLNPAPFDLHQLLQTLQEIFQSRAQAKQLSLQFNLATNLPQYVLTDEGKLRQVLINLLGNAVKFTQVGGVKLSVTATKEDEDNLYSLHFAVEDTGRGIAPEEMEHLFQPFVQTTSGTQAREGTGLGLTISRQFVQLMGGDIHLNSTVGQGTTFYFEVPVTLAEATTQAAYTTTRRVLKLAANQPIYKILVVDDRQENRDLIEQLLQSVGFEVYAANNGEEAIAQWQTYQPNLIWMDMRMPVMDGYDATRRIRQLQSADSKCIIIALTASAFEEQQASIIAAGCDDFVRKPFREQVLFDKMAQHLGLRYIYAQEDVEASKNETISSLTSLQPSCLQVMSSEWIAQLNQAALTVDGEQILQLIEQIPAPYRALATGLTEMVNNFCYDEILSLCEE